MILLYVIVMDVLIKIRQKSLVKQNGCNVANMRLE